MAKMSSIMKQVFIILMIFNKVTILVKPSC
jgi:hypothetical protein